MNKLILSIVFLLLCYPAVMAQPADVQKTDAPISLRFEYEDKCGSPLVESMIWSLVEGTVIKVVDGDTILMLTKENKRRRIDLAAVDASAADDAARRMLNELVLNRAVNVLVNPSNVKSKKVSGVVKTVGADVNRALIQAGAARYKEPAPYSMSNHASCVYRITESEAREAKRGLWQTVVSR
ncbi:MAG TPA: thermonuclease family protein [Pyrinomonadaceae bacterium]|jgi:endonuclease YncB( thermonuclease family)|nr:thermonuclease family protein [Pyrinomonadaceae bacterium]